MEGLAQKILKVFLFHQTMDVRIVKDWDQPFDQQERQQCAVVFSEVQAARKEE